MKQTARDDSNVYQDGDNLLLVSIATIPEDKMNVDIP